jgi:hypothetical protein
MAVACLYVAAAAAVVAAFASVDCVVAAVAVRVVVVEIEKQMMRCSVRVWLVIVRTRQMCVVVCYAAY